jgi:hypothetical protein
MSASIQPASNGANDTAHAQAALFVKSEDLSETGTKIRGPDFNMPHELQDLLNSYATIGFQASGLTKAIEIINRMVSSLIGSCRCCKRAGARARGMQPACIVLQAHKLCQYPADDICLAFTTYPIAHMEIVR